MPPPVLDRSVLETLTSELDTNTVYMILDNYMKESQVRARDFDNYLRDKDYETVQREAHSMKSSSASFGAMKLSELGKSIEMACRDNRHDEAEKLARDIEEITHETMAALDAWKQEQTG